MLLASFSLFWIAFAFLCGLGAGILCGWQLCRGLAEAQAVTMDDGQGALRVTLDPGAYPWSGAQVRFINDSEIEQ
jgi:hypothetical protein